jgi:hypothetical protein
MKVIEKKPNFLKLRTISAFWWITAGMFGICGSSYAVLLNTIIPIETSITTLTCNRQRPDRGICQLENSTFWSSQKRQIPLSSVQSARLNTSINNSVKQKQILIVTSSGEDTFSLYSSYNPQQAQAITSAINSFINNRLKTSLTIQVGYRWFSILGLIAVSIMATIYLCIMLMCLLQGVETWVFEKNFNGLTIKRQRLFGKKFTQHLQQGEIVEVELEKSENWNGDSIYRLIILPASGKSIPLSPVYSSGWEDKQEIRRSINTFIRTQELPITNENLGVTFVE